ncbi:hypothetical protein [Kribbella monticola]|uniref:hypothetical protein n=1 Tax=Kribbella monticola TaxID=2185285 RepID=UPI000DD2DFEB|nr:hypothetical protein [Kribbella monticola]
MTGLLKETLTERAGAVQEPHLDLDAIIGTGNRRIRRRRSTAIAAVAIASALILAGGVVTARHLADSAQPAGGVPTFKERRPTYSTGDKIHYGRDIIKVGPEKISSFVQIDTGFVYAADSGAVYFTDGSGDGRSDAKLGTGSSGDLAADDSGTLVGWVDDNGPATDEFVLYDVGTRHEIARTTLGNEKKPVEEGLIPQVLAIDNDMAYFAANDGLRSWDIGDGKGTLLKAGALPSELSDAANGKLAYPVIQPGGAIEGIGVARTLGPRNVIVPGAIDSANLSPDAAHVFTESTDTSRLFRSDGSGEIKLKSDHALLVQAVWLDNDRFVTLGIKTLESPEKNPLDLVTCSVRTATCTTAVKAFSPYPPDDGNPPPFQIPTGHRLP